MGLLKAEQQVSRLRFVVSERDDETPLGMTILQAES
jgi:hypothetical protein